MTSHCGQAQAGSSVRNRTDDDASREREAYRYLQPLQDLLQSDNHKTSPPKPQSCPDRALTAFAQLGALRIGARRSFISLFDRQNQYVLAEATKTLSLQKDTVHDEKDDLCIGVCTFSRNNTPCEYAAGLLEVPELVSSENTGEVIVFSDLREHNLFSQHTLVTERPHGRFYAGVPIISPDGYNIGVYCVMDDEPRDGLSTAEIDFMKDIATTVMSHLEMVRAKSELRRSHNMVQGLGDFLDGKASLKDWWRKVSYDDPKHEHGRGNSYRAPPRPSSEQSSVKRVRSMNLRPRPSMDSISSATSQRTSKPRAPALGKSSTFPSVVKEHNADATNLQEESISSDVRSTFQRAAEIIRESVDLDGAIFLDASVGTFAGLVDSVHGAPRKSSLTSSGSVGSTMTNDSFSKSPLAEKLCIVLGSSVVEKPLTRPSPPSSVSERFLHGLLAKYPKGKIWTYDQAENDSCETLDEPCDDTKSADFYNRRGDRWRERQTIKNMFPGVRSLALVGMWDAHRNRWFAGSILWTCNPTRVLYPDNELNYMVAFGQSIMAEVARIDVKMADKAKATFISSISHELRTPLHGIMGSSECLQSTDLDALQSSLVNTIETCGRTLLDTFDNLLSFAKINNLMTSSNYRRPSTPSASKMDSTRGGVAKVAEGPVDLSVLAEEVVETVFAGHEFVRVSPVRNGLAMGGVAASNNTSTNAPRGFEGINVILDYDTKSDWVFTAQAGGWIRVVMNLVGNSLKYTEKGSVTVRLDAKPSLEPELEGEVEVMLTVTDTGKGMTPEFLRSSLFSPFVQEDPLSPGTGLGLSIVKQIITQMGGTISVNSKKNEGTEIQVVVCMNRTEAPAESSKSSIISTVSGMFREKRVNLVGPQDETETAFVRLCKNWFDIPINFSTETEEADVYVITEKQARGMANQLASVPERLNPLARKPVIVLCKDFVSARALKSSNATSSISCCVEYMSQPLGPNKIAKVLAFCSDRLSQCDGLNYCSRSSRANSPVGQALAPRPGVNRMGSSMSIYSKNSNPDIILYTPTDEMTQERLMDGVKQSIEPSPTKTEKQPATEKTPLTSATLAASQQSLPGLSILLVDDNSINLNLLATFMKKQKHHYDTAMNGLDALEAYRDFATTINTPGKRRPAAYDFVLMDINMPVMDGLESTRHIRALEMELGLKPAMIIALTGMASVSAQQEAFASGVDLFLTKPVRLKELTKVLATRE